MAPIPWREIKLLLVEDEADLREVLLSVFESEGAQVFAVENGLAAIEVLKNNQIDLVVSDIRMPHFNGVQLLDYIQHRHPVSPPVPMLLMSGFADITPDQARVKGAIDLIYKPFNITSLFETIESHFHKK